MLNKLFLYFLALSFALTFVACDDDDDDNGDDPATTGNVSAHHAVADAPGQVQVTVDGNAVTTFGFGESFGYAAVPTGDRMVAINLSGSTDNLAEATQNVMDGANYSIFAHGTADAADNFPIALLALEDDLTAPESGKAHIRVVHASAGSPIVNIAASANDTTMMSEYLIEDLAYGSAVGFTPVDAGTYTFGIYAADSDAKVADYPGNMLEDGGIYTIFARGNLGDNFGVSVFKHN